MPLTAAERRILLQERKLLRLVVALAHRCDGAPPPPLLDAVLSGRVAALSRPTRRRRPLAS